MGFFAFIGIVVCAFIVVQIIKPFFNSPNNTGGSNSSNPNRPDSPSTVSSPIVPTGVDGGRRGAGYYQQQAEDYYHRGFRKVQQQNFQAAINDFNIAIQNNMQYENAYIMRGFCKVGLREVYSAVDDFTMAIRINQNSLPALALRGLIVSETEGDRADLISACEINPKNGMDYWALGTAKIALAEVSENGNLFESGMSDQLKAIELGFRIRLN